MGMVEHFEMSELSCYAFTVQHRFSYKTLKVLLSRWEDLKPIIPDSDYKDTMVRMLSNPILHDDNALWDDTMGAVKNISTVMEKLCIWVEGYSAGR